MPIEYPSDPRIINLDTEAKQLNAGCLAFDQYGSPAKLMISDFPDSGGGEPSAIPFAIVVDQKSSGAEGGSCTAGVWSTRDLNLKKSDDNNIVTLASNQMSLAAGTYRIQASAPCFGGRSNLVRLRDVTNSLTLLTGTSEKSQGGYAQVRSHLVGVFVLASPATIELQHYCSYSMASYGWGKAVSSGEPEEYAQVYLEKLA